MGAARRIADRYELVSEIGAGGMGVVWRARDSRLNRNVALKLLAAGTVGNDIARARLIREARAAAQLQHEGIVHVYDVGETDDGGAFLVMELVGGRSLRDLLDEGSLSTQAKLEIVVAVAEALGYAHDEGIVHRDVKPDNILVRKNGRPVVLDFGLAKPIPVGFADTISESASHASANLTKDGHIVGTPAYLAPEQIRGGTVGPAADQFALAVTAYELLTKRLPWKGENVLEVLASMLADEPRRANDDSSEVTGAVADVLERALAKEPTKRYASVSAFGAALAEASGIVPRSIPQPTTSAKASSVPPMPKSTPIRTSESAVQVPAAVSVGAPVAGTRSWSSRLRRGAIVAVVGGAVAFGLRATTSTKTKDANAADAAAANSTIGADDVVACPIFEVVRDDLPPPRGWFGAAAATLACEHAQALLGGLPERTLTPADLVKNIPREPADNATLDPFSVEGVAAESQKAASERGTAQIVGTVKRDGNDIAVSIVIRAKDGRELARSDGKGFELFTAISQAMRGARAAFAPMPASAFQSEWLRVSSIDAAEDYLDVTTAVLAEDNIDTATACDRFTARTDVKPEMLYFVRAVCAERLKRAATVDAPPAIDESSPGALVTWLAAHRMRGGAADTKARIERLAPLLARTTKPEERVIVAGAMAEMAYLAGDLARSASLARIAVQASPKLVDLRGTPWHRLAFASEFDRTIVGPHASWIAWEPVAVQNASSHGVVFTERIKAFGKGYELSRRGYFATAYAEGLARLGNLEQARGLAEQLDNEYLRVRVLMAQTLFRRAIEHGLEVLRKLPDDNANAGTAYRILAAITEASVIMGKKPAFTEEFLGKYLFVDPPRLKIGVVPFTSLVYVCTDAPSAVAKKCMKRLSDAYAKGEAGGVVGAAPTLLEGAQAWVAGDVKGAANAWRPLLRESGAFLDEAFRHVLLGAFDLANMSDLADHIESDYLGLVDYPRAYDLSLVRQAFRAEKRGDFALARKLAAHEIEALRYADAEIPVVKDLDALLKRLPK